MSDVELASGWWVYMIQTRSGKLYTGISTDPERRFQEHSGSRPGGARFFRGDPPACIVYREPSDNRSEASRREAEIKRLKRAEKLELIAQQPRAES